MRLPAAACLAASAAAMPALANDSLAVLGAGGLELTVSHDIVMESEELYLSPRQVRVRYVFRNESDRDITERVAFPLPDVPFGPMDNVALPEADKDNFVGFSVTADGRSIEPAVEQRAISAPVEADDRQPKHKQGTDITAEVLKAGLPINANLPSWKDKLSSLPLDARRRLVKQDLLYGSPEQAADLSAQWSLRATYHWEQTFPAHGRIVLEHSYQPIAGGAYVDAAAKEPIDLSRYKKDYCLDSAGEAGIRRLAKEAAKAHPDNALVPGDEVSYILTTGANWKGPIGNFDLTIDKLRPDAVLSLCIDGIAKTGPTTFKVQRSNFTPTEDIRFVVFSAKNDE